MKVCAATWLSFVFASVPGTRLVAQEAYTRLTIDGQALKGATDVTVRFAGQAQHLRFGPDRMTTTFLPGIVEGTLALSIETRRVGLDAHTWSKTIELNGSRQLVYALKPDGTGSMGQWPAVTWDATVGQLDVLVDGAALGTTRMKRGVEPDRKLLFVWQQQGVRKCAKEVSLPMNVVRRYACDPATGVVSGGD